MLHFAFPKFQSEIEIGFSNKWTVNKENISYDFYKQLGFLLNKKKKIFFFKAEIFPLYASF